MYEFKDGFNFLHCCYIMFAIVINVMSYRGFEKGVWPYINMMALSPMFKKQRKLYWISVRVIKRVIELHEVLHNSMS